MTMTADDVNPGSQAVTAPNYLAELNPSALGRR
jgi:hypothetical protein